MSMPSRDLVTEVITTLSDEGSQYSGGVGGYTRFSMGDGGSIYIEPLANGFSNFSSTSKVGTELLTILWGAPLITDSKGYPRWCR